MVGCHSSSPFFGAGEHAGARSGTRRRTTAPWKTLKPRPRALGPTSASMKSLPKYFVAGMVAFQVIAINHWRGFSSGHRSWCVGSVDNGLAARFGTRAVIQSTFLIKDIEHHLLMYEPRMSSMRDSWMLESLAVARAIPRFAWRHWRRPSCDNESRQNITDELKSSSALSVTQIV